jgi:hypothetical protein
LDTSQRLGALELRMLALPTGGYERSSSGPWATPTLKGNHNRAGLSPTSGDGLATQVAAWATPVASDSKCAGSGAGRRAAGMLRTQAGHRSLANNGLSSDWVEALMGFPPGWTSLPDGLPRAVKSKKRGSPAAPVPHDPSPTTPPASAPSETRSSRRSRP